MKDGISGGYADLVPGFRTIGYAGVVMDCCAFCDEDGKRKQLHINELANDAWDQALRRTGMGNAMGDYLVGQVAVVFGDREFMENL